MSSELERAAVVRVVNQVGMHLRVAVELKKMLGDFDASVFLSLVPGQRPDEEEDRYALEPTDCDDVLQVASLGARPGERLKLTVRGADCEPAFDKVVAYFENAFGEDKLPPDQL